MRINEDWCKGCKICLEVCPKKVFEEVEGRTDRGYPRIKAPRYRDCNLCKLCEIYCPDLAITVQKKDDGGLKPA